MYFQQIVDLATAITSDGNHGIAIQSITIGYVAVRIGPKLATPAQ